MPTTLAGKHDPGNLISFAKGLEAGGSDKNITVHPTRADRVGFSGYISFISDDGGTTWSPLGSDSINPSDGVPNTPHHHVDHHMVLFAPESSFPERVYVATDGGVFHAEDWRMASTLRSEHNHGLRTLQFYSPISERNFLGSLGSMAAPRGIVAGGLQDNGNVWKTDNALSIWQQSETDDGGYNCMVGTNIYLHHNEAGVTFYREWSHITNQLGSATPVPIGPLGGGQDNSGLAAKLQPVQNPSFRDSSGHLLHALGWIGNRLFGLFGEDNGASPFWIQLTSLVDTAESIVTAASHDGTEILFATSKKNTYQFEVSNNNIVKMSIAKLPDGSAIYWIVTAGPGEAYAASNPGKGSLPMAKRNGTSWVPITPVPLSSSREPAVIYGFDTDDTTDPPLLLAATDTRLWASNDRGEGWVDISAGLPVQPHCADLRFNRVKRRWHLATYGRSMWQGGKFREVGVSSLIQSDFVKGAEHHNFEALLLENNDLFHYWKDNGDVNNPWQQGARLTDKATAPACLISSDYPKNADHHNFEALVLESRTLTHFFRDNQNDELAWARVAVVTQECAGPASMIQSDYRSDEDHGNFEALIPMDDGLWHWFRNGATEEWDKVAKLSNIPGSLGRLISSDYEDNPGHRNFEALIFEPSPVAGVRGEIWHLFWNGSIWQRTVNPLSRNALGPACLIQSDYVKNAEHHNLEALLWEVDHRTQKPVLRHYFRDSQGDLNIWFQGPIVTDRMNGPASMIQSDFHSDEDHGNLEVICVESDNDVWHHWRNEADTKWYNGGPVS